MRRPTSLLLLVLAACGGDEPDGYVVIADFLARSEAVSCSPLAGPLDGLAVTELRTASDSTVLVLDGPGRRILELDPTLRPLWSMDAPAAGPGALEAPVDVAALGDTAVVVAERRGIQLIVFRRDGTLVRTLPLPFIPASLAPDPWGGVLVATTPVGRDPSSLLFRYDGEEMHEIGVPPRYYDDMIVSILGNTTKVGVLSGGDALVVHQFMEPRGFRVAMDGAFESLRVPTPDATRSQISYIPVPPIRDDQVPLILVPSIAMSVDRRRSEVYLLTRSGRIRGDNAERAVLRLDDRLGFLESYTIDVAARGLAYLPGPELALVVDDKDNFHACRLTHRDNHHARVD